MATKKRAKKKKAATLRVQDLRTATAASVRAVLGSAAPRIPGSLAGPLLSDALLAKLKKSPAAIAQQITKQVSAASGLKLKPGVVRGEGGILVGYQLPGIAISE